ncbi:hypothetical protein CNYM01_05204, partial [Colletotrichum nymphaeae SA-01]
SVSFCLAPCLALPCLFLDSPRLLTAFFSPSPPARSSGAAIVTPIGLGCSSRSILSPRLVGIHVLPPAQPILAPIYFDLPLSCWQLYIYPYTRPPSLNLPCSFCHCHSVSNQPVRRCFSTLDLFPKPPDKLSTVHYTSRRNRETSLHFTPFSSAPLARPTFLLPTSRLFTSYN